MGNAAPQSVKFAWQSSPPSTALLEWLPLSGNECVVRGHVGYLVHGAGDGEVATLKFNPGLPETTPDVCRTVLGSSKFPTTKAKSKHKRGSKWMRLIEGWHCMWEQN